MSDIKPDENNEKIENQDNIEQKEQKENEESTIKKVKDFLTGEEKDEKAADTDKEEKEIKAESKAEKEKVKEKERAKKIPGFFEFIFSNWYNPNVGKSKEEIEAELKKENDENTDESEKGKKKSIGTIGKLKALYNDYLKIREKELEKLEIYESIEDSARMSKEFLILLISSCIIASLGLIQDSTAVIIGGMLIAPLMMPILGFSLGVIWGDKRLILRSFSILLVASALVILITSSLAAILPGVYLSLEMNARINPTLYDIFIALASGVIGAYAYVNPKMSSSISGVAIAVALMPPLCTVGISIGLGEFQPALGASLLYLTNLIGIALAGSIVFWRLKIHPITESSDEVKERAKRKILVSVFMLILIAIPLGYFMRETYLLKQNRESVKKIITKGIEDVTILDLEVKRFTKFYKVKAIVFFPVKINKAELLKMKDEIRQIFDKETKIQLMVMENILDTTE